MGREGRDPTDELGGQVQPDEGGWYRLDLGHQPLVVPGDVDVAISVPKGWRIAETRGLDRRGPRQAEARVRLDGERALLVRVERTGWSAFWHRLTAG